MYVNKCIYRRSKQNWKASQRLV